MEVLAFKKESQREENLFGENKLLLQKLNVANKKVTNLKRTNSKLEKSLNDATAIMIVEAAMIMLLIAYLIVN